MEHSSPWAPSSNCLNDDEGGLSYSLDVPYEYREAPFHTRIQDIRPLPNSVNSVNIIEINSNVFSGNTDIVSVVLNDNITTIPNSAFKDCTNLASFTMSSNVTDINDEAFSGCTSIMLNFIIRNQFWLSL